MTFIFVFLTVNLLTHADEVLSLEDFIHQVREQNLRLKAESAKTDAMDAKAIGVNLPPPMVGIVQMTMKEDRSKATGFEVSQTLPFPRKLLNDRSARQLEAQAQVESQKAVSSEVLAKARIVYFSLWSAQEKLQLLKEKKAALLQHIKLSRATSRSDSFAQVHLLKAETDVDALDNELLVVEQELRNKQIEAAELVNTDPAQYWPTVKAIPITTLPSSASIEAPHQLESTRLTLESMRARESEAKSAWFPELNFRYKQMGASAMFPAYNEIMVGMSLPFVFFWEPRAASISASAQRIQADFEYSQEKRKIEGEKASLLAKAESLKKQLENLQTRLLPKAERRMRLVHNLTPRDLETLQDHREAMEAFPDLKLKALEYREQYEEVVSGLQKYTKDSL